jgi:hypothetical protein
LSCRRLATAVNGLVDGSLPRPTKYLAGRGCRPHAPLSAALGLSFRRLATAGNEALGKWRLPPQTPAFRCARLVLQEARYRGNETLAILRTHLRTRKVIRFRGLQRRSVCCTHRRRVDEMFYRCRGGKPRTLPSSLRSDSPAVGSLLRATNAAMTVASNFSRR